MGGKKKYIEMFGSFTEPFNCSTQTAPLTALSWNMAVNYMA